MPVVEVAKIMSSVVDDPTLPPRYVIESYRRIYEQVNGATPTCTYVGNHWYNINGETVHRSVLMGEIARLRDLTTARQRPPANRSILQRLIDRLRNL